MSDAASMATQAVTAGFEPPALLTLDQAADSLQLDRVTLWRWSLTGRFPVAVLRLGRARRVRTAELAAWIGAGCPAGRERWTWTA